METGALGKVYQDGENVFSQGEEGNCMYVIQEGKVEVLVEQGGKEVQVAIRSVGDFVGEMLSLKGMFVLPPSELWEKLDFLPLTRKISCAELPRTHHWHFE